MKMKCWQDDISLTNCKHNGNILLTLTKCWHINYILELKWRHSKMSSKRLYHNCKRGPKSLRHDGPQKAHNNQELSSQQLECHWNSAKETLKSEVAKPRWSDGQSEHNAVKHSVGGTRSLIVSRAEWVSGALFDAVKQWSDWWRGPLGLSPSR